MKTIIAILLLMLFMKERLSTKKKKLNKLASKRTCFRLSSIVMLINLASRFVYGRNLPISSTYLSRKGEIHYQKTKATAVIINAVHFRKVFLA